MRESLEFALGDFVDAERRAEAVRAEIHAQEAARYAGVAWSGFAPESYQSAGESTLQARAAEALARRRAWRQSRTGEVLTAVASIQQAAEAANAAAEALRAAFNRNGATDLCAQSAAKILSEAQALLLAAQSARRALDQAG